MDDKQIIALYWQRSENAISETAQKYGRYCQTVAGNILQNQEDAQECVNDAYLKAWNAIPPARPDNLRTFLGKIVRNLALNRWEAETAEKRGGGAVPQVLEELHSCLPASDPTERILDGLLLKDVLDRFLASLKPDARKIFVRRYWYLSSVKEIAAEFGMTESKVTVTLCRTRQRLAKMLEKEGIGL